MSAQDARLEQYEYIVTNTVSLVATTITIWYISKKPAVK
jgi:hypothetical protein